MDFSLVVLAGRLTRDPKLYKSKENGESFCKFGMAVNPYGSKRGSSQPLFIEVLVWRRSADACAEHLVKGQGVLVSGSLQCRRWDSDDGPRQIIQVFADSVQFGQKPKRNGENTERNGENVRRISDSGDDDVEF